MYSTKQSMNDETILKIKLDKYIDIFIKVYKIQRKTKLHT